MSYARYYRFFATLTLTVGLVLTNVIGQFRPLSITRLIMPSKATAEGVPNPASNSSSFDPAEKKRVLAEASNRPLSFEPNLGQTDSQVKFFARGGGGLLFLTPTEAVLSISGKKAEKATSSESRRSTVLRMKFVGANPTAKVEGLDPLQSKSNYFIGNDPNPDKPEPNRVHF